MTGNWNPDSYSIDELFKATVAILELAVLEQRAQILGGICIFDLGGISLQHAWNITPSVARRTVELMVVSFIHTTFPSP
jgi:cell division FtsZ-interacting protein ZapD